MADATRCEIAGQFASALRIRGKSSRTKSMLADNIVQMSILSAIWTDSSCGEPQNLTREPPFAFLSKFVSVMKSLFPRFLTTFFCFGSAALVSAADFKSAVVTDVPLGPIHVARDHFLVIRNFTQEGGTTRGLVNVYDISSGQFVNVLAAAIIDTDPSTPVEVINNVVIDGPANVTVTCGTGATCFVTYRKESD